MSLLANAVAAMHSTVLAAAGVAGKYKRGTDEIERTFIPGRSVSTDYGEDGAAIVARTHDWIETNPDGLLLIGQVVKPKVGDRFDTDDGRSFRVVYGEGESCWRWTDQTQQAIRIHTVEQKKINE
jgi:hypothetical protein